MPTEYYYDHRKYAMQNPESGKKLLNSSQFKNAEKYPDEKKKDLDAWMFAIRMSINAVRGKKDSLKKGVSAETLKQNYEFLTINKTFADFVAAQKHEGMKKLLSEGHGGAAEDAFPKYVLKSETLPGDVPDRYMPTAEERIDALKQKIDDKDFRSLSAENRQKLYAELLGARRAVNAQRNKPELLKQTIEPEQTREETEKLIKSKTFREFLDKNPDAARKAATSDHGGALEDAFKDYVQRLDRIPADVPQSYMPTAKERIEFLQRKIKSGEFANLQAPAQNMFYKELVATRAAAEAERNNPGSLDVQLDAGKLDEARTQIYADQGTDAFFDRADRRLLLDAAKAGHGGALEDKLKEDILAQTVRNGIVPKAPDRYLPTAAQVKEALRGNLEEELKVFNNPSFDENKEVTMRKVASMMYLTKREREQPDAALDPADMKRTVDALVGDAAFQRMFRSYREARYTARLVKENKMSQILINHGQYAEQLRQAQPQQAQLQLQQNQPVVNAEHAQQQNVVDQNPQQPEHFGGDQAASEDGRGAQ